VLWRLGRGARTEKNGGERSVGAQGGSWPELHKAIGHICLIESKLEIDMSVLDNRDVEPAYVGMTSTERSRVSRERRRRGLRLVPVEILDGEVNWLVDVGLLPISEHDDPRKIGRAIERLLERSSRKPN
jgi:hypothetical protein